MYRTIGNNKYTEVKYSINVFEELEMNTWKRSENRKRKGTAQRGLADMKSNLFKRFLHLTIVIYESCNFATKIELKLRVKLSVMSLALVLPVFTVVPNGFIAIKEVTI